MDSFIKGQETQMTAFWKEYCSNGSPPTPTKNPTAKLPTPTSDDECTNNEIDFKVVLNADLFSDINNSLYLQKKKREEQVYQEKAFQNRSRWNKGGQEANLQYMFTEWSLLQVYYQR